METWEAFLLGIVQGLTEFLPVSSSGHLLLSKEILGIENNGGTTFEVLVHAATVLSTITVFRNDIAKLIAGLFKF
ncbi:MAG: UDP-diphosphatase, partial [Prevotellaceae bacterium]|nr:UDP-diphosphatase [Prevotellaceae bacterium]